jgi:hypothetical protein
MSGYSGYSKSWGAVYAESDGKLPMTHAIKAVVENVGCTRKQARSALEREGPSEWHHTSKKYNRTDYYDIASAGDRVQSMADNVAIAEHCGPDWHEEISAAISEAGQVLAARLEAIQKKAESIGNLVKLSAQRVIDAYYYG